MMKRFITYYVYFSIIVGVLAGCKEDDGFVDDPYPPGKELLNVKISPVKFPEPAVGAPGTEVTVFATGLDKLKAGSYDVLFNGQKAEIIGTATANSVRVRVPENASTGNVSVASGIQIVFGPRFEVVGLVNVDRTFKADKGTNGFISQIIEYGGDLIAVGAFQSFQNAGMVIPLNGIVRFSPDGVVEKTFNAKEGASGMINQIAATPSRLFIAGSFGGFGEMQKYMNNITRILPNGTIDSTVTTTIENKELGIPSFNGGTDANINNMHLYNDKIIVSGWNIRHYIYRRYNEGNSSNKLEVKVDSIDVDQIFRMNLDGSLDRTWRFTPDVGDPDRLTRLPRGEGKKASNGFIQTLMHYQGEHAGKVLVFGAFTSFEGKPAGSIIRLNADGTIDPTFNPGLGTNYIYNVTLNEKTRKYMVSGIFTQFNGKPANAIVMLNLDGSVDETFNAKAFNSAPRVYFARQLDNGLIVVSGEFIKYNNVNRDGFMILNPSGDLAPGYNNVGGIKFGRGNGGGGGGISDFYETQSTEKKKALLLYGFFDQFNGNPANSILRVTIE